MPGIMMSRRTRSGPNCRSFARHSSPLEGAVQFVVVAEKLFEDANIDRTVVDDQNAIFHD